MPEARFLTHADRAYRREKIFAAYQRGAKPRELAERFGLSVWHVKDLVRGAGDYRERRRASGER